MPQDELFQGGKFMVQKGSHAVAVRVQPDGIVHCANNDDRFFFGVQKIVANSDVSEPLPTSDIPELHLTKKVHVYRLRRGASPVLPSSEQPVVWPSPLGRDALVGASSSSAGPSVGQPGAARPAPPSPYTEQLGRNIMERPVPSSFELGTPAGASPKRRKLGKGIISSFQGLAAPSPPRSPRGQPPEAVPAATTILARVSELRRGATEAFPNVSADVQTTLTLLKYLVDEAKMTDFKLLSHSKLALLLALRCDDLRAHEYNLFEYEESSGAWLPAEVIVLHNKDILLAAEGVLLKVHVDHADDEPPLEWDWETVGPIMWDALRARIQAAGSDSNALSTFVADAKKAGDYMRRVSCNKPWNCHYIPRLADALSKLVLYFDTDSGMSAMTKLFLRTCSTPLPACRGTAFVDKYIDDSGNEVPRRRENDCYFKAPFKFDVTEADVTKPGWSIRRYDEELDLWIQSMYYNNDAFFSVKLLLWKLAFKGKEAWKMTFECGKGGDGKGREFVFEKALFGHSFGSLDCAVFLDRSEWRRSAQFAWNKRCIRIQEFDSVSRVLADIWKRFVVGEERASRRGAGEGGGAATPPLKRTSLNLHIAYGR